MNKIAVTHVASNLPEKHTEELGTMTFYIHGASRVFLSHIVRHRTFSFSVESMRFVDKRKNSIVNTGAYDTDYFNEETRNWYDELRSVENVKKQDARYILPLGSRTEIVVTMPLKYAKNFFRLRLHKSAQPETRFVAMLMFDIVFHKFISVYGNMEEWADIIDMSSDVLETLFAKEKMQ